MVVTDPTLDGTESLGGGGVSITSLPVVDNDGSGEDSANDDQTDSTGYLDSQDGVLWDSGGSDPEASDPADVVQERNQQETESQYHTMNGELGVGSLPGRGNLYLDNDGLGAGGGGADSDDSTNDRDNSPVSGPWGNSDYGEIDLGNRTEGGGYELPTEGGENDGRMGVVDVPNSVGDGGVLVDSTNDVRRVNDAIGQILDRQGGVGGSGEGNDRGDDGSGNVNQGVAFPNFMPFNAGDMIPEFGVNPALVGVGVLGLGMVVVMFL